MNGRDTVKKWGARVLVVLLVPGLSGCLTSKLWSDEYSDDNRHWAATNAPPAFFQTKDGKDVLVLYQEGRDTDFETRLRAYLLYANMDRIDRGKRPQFVDASMSADLRPIPLSTASLTNRASGEAELQALLLPDGRHFTLASKGTEIGTYGLPDYVQKSRRPMQIILTPLTVTGDIIIVGAATVTVFGLFWLLTDGWPEGKVVDSHWKP